MTLETDLIELLRQIRDTYDEFLFTGNLTGTTKSKLESAAITLNVLVNDGADIDSLIKKLKIKRL